MSDHSIERIKDLFLSALQIPTEDRQAWLAERCGDDTELLKEVLSLLEHDTPSDDPFEGGIDADQLAEAVVGHREHIGMHVRCPHCHSPIELVDDREFDDVVCSSCGSRFCLVSPEETKSHDTSENRRVAHFDLLSRVGAGAFGTVYRARDTQLDRTVAVKIPRQGQLSLSESEKFLREARAAAQLRHPHIVSVHEVGLDRGSPYIVSDFVDGLTLADWLTGKSPTAREAANLCTTIADSLHHAHENGVIHRDLKPSNIMLGQDGQPHLMDFGLAKRDVGEITMTLDGQILGTPAYMSPEQAKGEGHQVDRRADIYSLGVVLYELLAGERPFRGNTRMLLHQVLTEDARRPRAYDANIPADLETICLKCLEKEPERRYQTAEQLADDLRRFIDGKPVLARPISLAERGVRWCRRNQLVASLVGLAAAAMIAGTAVATYFAIDAATERDNAIQLAGEKNLLAVEKTQLAAEAIDSERKTSLQLVETEMTKSHLAFETGHSDQGLASLARALASVPDDEPEMADGIRASLAGYARSTHLLRHVLPLEGTLKQVVFSPGGNYIMAISRPATDQTVVVPDHVQCWNVKTGLPVSEQIDLSDQVQFRKAKPFLCVPPQGDVFGLSTIDGVVYVFRFADGKLMARLEHPEPITAMEFDRDGSHCVTACEDGVVRVWRVEVGEVQKAFEHPKANAACLRNDDTVVTAGTTVRVWDLETGEQRVPEFSPGRVLDVSVNGTRLLSLENETKLVGRLRRTTNMLQLWSLETGEQIGESREHYSGGFDFFPFFSSQGSLFFNVYRPNDAVSAYEYTFCDATTGEAVLSFKDSRALTRVAFSPNERIFAMGALRGFSRLRELLFGAPVGAALEHNAQITNLKFGAGGRLLLTTSLDGETKIWETTDGRQIGQSLLHPVASIEDNEQLAVIDQYGRFIALPSPDGFLQVWQLARGPGDGVQVGTGKVTSTTIAPGGRTVYLSSKEGTQAWDLASASPVGPLLNSVGSAHLTPDGKILIANGGTELRDPATGELLRPAIEIDRKQNLYGLTADCSYAVIVRSNKNKSSEDIPNISVVSTKTGNSVSGLPDKLEWLAADGARHQRMYGKRCLHGSSDRIHIWRLDSLPSGLQIQHPHADGKAPRIRSYRFIQDGMAVLTTADDGSIRVWDATTGEAIGPAMEHPEGLTGFGMTLSADEKRILCVSRNNAAYVWDLRTRKQIAGPLKHQDVIRHAEFSPDGRMILTSGSDHLAHLWNADNGEPIGRPMVHDHDVVARFSPDGRLIASVARGSRFNVFHLWHARTQREVMLPIRHYDHNQAEFVLDGKAILASCSYVRPILHEIPQADNSDEENVHLAVEVGTGRVLSGERMTTAQWQAKHHELTRRSRTDPWK